MNGKEGYITAKCPYFKWAEDGMVHCEGHIIKSAASKSYRAKHCDSLNGWCDCIIARALTAKYEKEETP